MARIVAFCCAKRKKNIVIMSAKYEIEITTDLSKDFSMDLSMNVEKDHSLLERQVFDLPPEYSSLEHDLKQSFAWNIFETGYILTFTCISIFWVWNLFIGNMNKVLFGWYFVCICEMCYEFIDLYMDEKGSFTAKEMRGFLRTMLFSQVAVFLSWIFSSGTLSGSSSSS
jgi:hypothetical protein